MSPRHGSLATRLGELAIVMTGSALSGLYFPGHWRAPERALAGDAMAPDDADLQVVATELHAWLAGDITAFTLDVQLEGSDFDVSVWRLLQEIAYGERVTYGELAQRLGNPGMAQRVGQAVGANPVSIVVPCHRVIGATGELTGYAGGLERKAWLLALEDFISGASFIDPR